MEWRPKLSSIWSRKPMPVSMSHSPVPSRSSETVISVSRVFLSTVAVRIFTSPPAFAPDWCYGHLPRQGCAHGGGGPGQAARICVTRNLYSSALFFRESLQRHRICKIWHILLTPRGFPVKRGPQFQGPG